MTMDGRALALLGVIGLAAVGVARGSPVRTRLPGPIPTSEEEADLAALTKLVKLARAWSTGFAQSKLTLKDVLEGMVRSGRFEVWTLPRGQGGRPGQGAVRDRPLLGRASHSSFHGPLWWWFGGDRFGNAGDGEAILLEQGFEKQPFRRDVLEGPKEAELANAFVKTYRDIVLPGEPEGSPVRTGLSRPALPRVVQTRVTADVDGRSVRFDAAPWFAQASDASIESLADVGWGGDYQADDVARFLPKKGQSAKVHKGITDILDDPGGFEVRVDEEDAIAWLEENRPALAERLWNRGSPVRTTLAAPKLKLTLVRVPAKQVEWFSEQDGTTVWEATYGGQKWSGYGGQDADSTKVFVDPVRKWAFFVYLYPHDLPAVYVAGYGDESLHQDEDVLRIEDPGIFHPSMLRSIHRRLAQEAGDRPFGSPVRTRLSAPRFEKERADLVVQIVKHIDFTKSVFMNDHRDRWRPNPAMYGVFHRAGFPYVVDPETTEGYARDLTSIFVDRETKKSFQHQPGRPYEIFWSGLGVDQTALYVKSVKTRAEVMLELAALYAEIPDDPVAVLANLKRLPKP